MNFQFKHRFSGSVLFEIETTSLKLGSEAAVKSGANLRGAYLGGADLRDAYLGGANLRGADLGDADLRGADLGDADLGDADLGGADLSDANLRGANLGGANLGGAYLRVAYLRGADLRDADLSGAYLGGADLRDADLGGAYLCGADLRGADLRDAYLRGAYLGNAYLYGVKNLKFVKFPTIAMLSSFDLGELPDDLTSELMRRDAYAHPHPEKFEVWADNGPCPYRNEERFWKFEISRKLWKPGHPEMRDSDLVIRICKAKGFQIKNYLE